MLALQLAVGCLLVAAAHGQSDERDTWLSQFGIKKATMPYFEDKVTEIRDSKKYGYYIYFKGDVVYELKPTFDSNKDIKIHAFDVLPEEKFKVDNMRQQVLKFFNLRHLTLVYPFTKIVEYAKRENVGKHGKNRHTEFLFRQWLLAAGCNALPTRLDQDSLTFKIRTPRGSFMEMPHMKIHDVPTLEDHTDFDLFYVDQLQGPDPIDVENAVKQTRAAYKLTFLKFEKGALYFARGSLINLEKLHSDQNDHYLLVPRDVINIPSRHEDVSSDSSDSSDSSGSTETSYSSTSDVPLVSAKRGRSEGKAKRRSAIGSRHAYQRKSAGWRRSVRVRTAPRRLRY